MPHFMIDLETLGQRAGCVVLSIGAVAFDPIRRTIDPEGFYCVVNKRDCLDRGLTVDASTVAWWERQDPIAQQVLAEADTTGIKLETALCQLDAFFRSRLTSSRTIIPWSCGADFDLPILVECYHRCGIQLPWKFWDSRCFRTLKALGGGKKYEPSRMGTYHNALDDALHQAQWALDIAKQYGFVL
jgi:hypothetical protein